jgi:hypothetical protein
MVWRSQTDEIETLRAEVRNLRGEMASQRAELEEMDTLVERMVLCDSTAQMQFVLGDEPCGSSFSGSKRSTRCYCISRRPKGLRLFPRVRRVDTAAAQLCY